MESIEIISTGEADFFNSDLNQLLVKNPFSTFYANVKGNTMAAYGIEEGDLLIIDKSIEAEESKIAVCFIDNQFTLRIISKKDKELYLLTTNIKDTPEKIKGNDEHNNVWGIVIKVIKKV